MISFMSRYLMVSVDAKKINVLLVNSYMKGK